MLMASGKNKFFKEAEKAFLSSPSEKTVRAYIFAKYLKNACFMLAILFAISTTFVFFNKTQHIAGLISYGFFILFLICGASFFFVQPHTSFFIDVVSEINKNARTLEIKNSEKNNVPGFSEAMKYWTLAQLVKEERNENYLRYLETFSEVLRVSVNHQNTAGDTILHIMLVDEPDSPFISRALFLNADIYLTNKKGISVYELLKKKIPEYIVFLEKSMLVKSVNVPAASISIKRL